MNKETYRLIENYMLSCMDDSAHDKDHIYRVLYMALEIAQSESQVNYDVLVTACLLHDIGRKEQFANPTLCHAQVGSEKAYQFLIEQGFGAEFAEKVKHCIVTHRFRKNNPPQTVEAKILFDADKLDTVGALGIARSLQFNGAMSEPLYSLKADGTVSDGVGDEQSSFFREYKFKLENIYSRFMTESGARLAKQREQSAIDFYNELLRECSEPYEKGKKALNKIVK